MILALLCGPRAQGARIEVPLDGAWLFSAQGGTNPVWQAAEVPGCVHTDLLRLKAIPDPFVGLNEDRVQYVERLDWAYRRTFEVGADVLGRRQVDLECDGLDTLASVRLNGVVIGNADNMFRRWSFPARDALRAGTNVLEVVFQSPMRALPTLPEYRLGALPASNDPVGGSPFFRKAPYQFGWDWGPRLATCGIWKSLRLVATDDPRITYVTTRQAHELVAGTTNRVVALRVDVEMESPRACQAALSMRTAGVEAHATVTVPAGRSRHALLARVDNPRLWWPAGAGEQALYPLDVSVVPADGSGHSWKGRIGFRTVQLETERDDQGVSFRFVVNGQPVFCKGANWIPCDAFPSRVSADRYRSLLTDAAACHMNMIRVWGGGIYESDTFYDLCDELGLMVWQDFMFACSLYPADEHFLANVTAEAGHQLRRLNPHPSLVLWCGNNECESAVRRWYRKESTEWGRYAALFHGVLPALCRDIDPDRPYWPSSPHSIESDDPGSPTDGDVHVWSVWHESQPFETYGTIFPRFVSEFGYQSLPTLATIRSYAGEALNLGAPAVAAHQKNRGGNTRILTQLLERFRLPHGFANLVTLSQIQQGVAMQTAVDHWRRQMPVCMGTLYWQWDDCWPVTSWSAVDYFGRRKALYYFSRRFYEPFHVTTTGGEGTAPVTVHVTSDAPLQGVGSVNWALQTYAGRRVAGGQGMWTNVASGTKVVLDVPADLWLVDDHLAPAPWAEITPRNTYLSVEARLGDQVSRTVHHFARFKDLDLPHPALQVKVEARPGGARLRVSSDVFAKWVWVETGDGAGGRFADNFFDLQPGETRTLEYEGPMPARFAAHSLVDTFTE